MKTQLRAVIPIVIAAVTLPSAVHGCSILIEPPLWVQIHDADAIVLASVRSIDDPSDEDASPRLHLNVIERWKGDVPGELVVTSGANLLPADVVAVFLEKGEPNEEPWSEAFIPPDLVNASPEDLDIYAARVREGVAIGEKEKGRISRMEWLVRCAEHRVTRADAVSELAPRELEDSDYSDNICITPFEILTDEHRLRIADGFIREPRIDFALPTLLEVLEGYEDPKFQRTVVAAIEAELALPGPVRLVVEKSAIAAGQKWDVTFPTLEAKHRDAGVEVPQGGWAQIIH
jgi:hypothetical protein